jgi:carboxyl-terminal processing protease
MGESIASGKGMYLLTPSAGGKSSSPFPTQIADSETGSSSDSTSDQLESFLNNDSPAATFDNVYMLLKEFYVDRIDSDVPLIHGAAASLVSALDEPNSRFMDSKEREAVEAQSKGLYQGIGAVLIVRKVTRPDTLIDRELTVTDSLPGSGAEKAGLRTGDIITSINGHWILSYDPFADQTSSLKKLENDPYALNKAIEALQKKETQAYALDKAQTILDTTSVSPLTLTIRRTGSETPLTVTVDASNTLQVKSVEYHKLANGTGYIGVNEFDDNTTDEFKSALAEMNSSKGLIIDLRDCPGGSITPGIEIAKMFSPDADFATVLVRSKHNSKSTVDGIPTDTKVLKTEKDTSSDSAPYHGQVTVLVNSGTANTAELLAAFLHDKVGAGVIGAKTFGDASAQTLYPLSDGSAFSLETGLLKTDNNIAFNQVGIAPQFALADPGHPGDSDSDASITKALSYLATKQDAKKIHDSSQFSAIKVASAKGDKI